MKIEPSEDIKREIAILMENRSILDSIRLLRSNIDWMPNIKEAARMVLKIYRISGGKNEFQFENLIKH